MKLSLIIPCHNEAENVRPFVERTLECMELPEAPETLEMIFVDDGSTDSTFANVARAM